MVVRRKEHAMPAKLAFLALSMLFPAVVFAQAGPPGPYRDWADWPGPWHMMGWGWGFGWIFPLLMIFVFALCVFFMIRMFAGHGHPMHRDSTRSALEILSERFARGEISKEEFEEKRATLARRP
jgi:putative membrane protein